MKIQTLLTLLLFLQCKPSGSDNAFKSTSKIGQQENNSNSSNLICAQICFSFPKKINKSDLESEIPIVINIDNNTDQVIITGEDYIIEIKKKWSLVKCEIRRYVHKYWI